VQSPPAFAQHSESGGVVPEVTAGPRRTVEEEVVADGRELDIGAVAWTLHCSVEDAGLVVEVIRGVGDVELWDGAIAGSALRQEGGEALRGIPLAQEVVWERAIEIAQGERRESRAIEGVSETDRLQVLVADPARHPWGRRLRVAWIASSSMSTSGSTGGDSNVLVQLFCMVSERPMRAGMRIFHANMAQVSPPCPLTPICYFLYASYFPFHSTVCFTLDE
jgi:hypothetical protein